MATKQNALLTRFTATPARTFLHCQNLKKDWFTQIRREKTKHMISPNISSIDPVMQEVFMVFMKVFKYLPLLTVLIVNSLIGITVC